MSRFYGDIKGNRGEATRMGTTSSGMEGHIRGWNIGYRVVCHSRDTPGKQIDECVVYETKGSNGYGSSKEIARIQDPPIMNPKWKFEEKK